MKTKVEKKDYYGQINELIIDPLINAYLDESGTKNIQSASEEKARLTMQLNAALDGFTDRVQSAISALENCGLSFHGKELREVFKPLTNQQKCTKLFEEGKTIQDVVKLTDDELLSCYKEGSHLYERHNYHEASNIFLLLCQINPKVAVFWTALGAAEEQCGEIEGALQAYLLAAEIEDSTLSPYLRAAQCLIRLHRNEQAKIVLERALERVHEEPSLKQYKAEIEKMLRKVR